MTATHKKKFAKYPSYKPTGIDWLGKIPSEWEVKRLKYLANIETGSTPPKKDEENYADSGTPWIKPDNLCDLFPLSDSEEYLSKIGTKLVPLIPAGSVLVNCIGNVGKIGIAGCTLATNQQINSVIPTESIYQKRFAAYAISASASQHQKFSNLVVVAILNKTNQLKISFPLPSPEQQKIISDFLDKETEKIDKLIDKKQKLIERLKGKRTALISQAVTKGLDPKVKMKDSGIPWLGQIPDHWEVKKAKLCFKVGKEGIKIGPFGSSLKAEFIKENGYKIYGQEHVIANDFDIGEKYIDDEKFTELSQYEIKPGDVLVTMMGTTGKCQIVPDGIKPGIMDSHLIRIRPARDISLSQYFSLLIQESNYIRTQFDLSSKGSIMEGLNSSIISSLFILLPPIDEQKAVLSAVNEKNNSISILIGKIEKQIEKIKEYRTALISSAVTGKIKVDL